MPDYPKLPDHPDFLVVPDSRPESYVGEHVRTYRTGESSVYVGDLILGDAIRFWLKAHHTLIKMVIAKKTSLQHRYYGKNSGKIRGYQINQGTGSLQENDIPGQRFVISVSPGAHGFAHAVTGLATVPWVALSRIEIVRRRIDPVTGIDNPRFPYVLPVRFR